MQLQKSASSCPFFPRTLRTVFGQYHLAWLLDTGLTDSDQFQDEFTGSYDNAEGYGYQYFDSIHGISKLEKLGVEYYVDWENYGEGLLTGVSHAEYNNRLYVFG